MNPQNRAARVEHPGRRSAVGRERPATAASRGDAGSWMLSFGPAVFWLLAAVVLINVNHISNMMFGFGWPITVFVALCGMFVCIVSRLSAVAVLGLPGIALIAALALYSAIGAGVAVLNGDNAAALAGAALPYRPWLAILAAAAAALGIGAELRRSGFQGVMKALLVIHTVICVLILFSPVLVQHLYMALKDQVLWSAEFRAFGPFANPNNAGMAACQSAAVALAALTARTHRKLAGLLLPLALAAAAASFSRTAWLAVAAVLAAAFCWQMSRGREGARVETIAIWAGAAVLTAIGASIAIQFDLLTVSERQFERLVSLIDMGQTGGGGSVRLGLWLDGLFRIAGAPLFGHGIGAFHAFTGAPVDCWNGLQEIPCGVHNAYLLFWGEAGVIPAALLCLFVACFLWRSVRLPRSAPMNAASGLVLVFAIACLFSSNEPYTLWNAFVLGIACALAAYAERQARRANIRVPATEPISAAPGARAPPPDARKR